MNLPIRRSPTLNSTWGSKVTHRIISVVFFAALLTGCVNVTGDSRPEFTPTVTPPTVVAEFSLTLSGTNFDFANAELLLVRIVEGPNVIACSETVAIANGQFEVTFQQIFVSGSNYTVEFFANTDGNSVYNSGIDRTFRVELTDVTSDIVQSYDAVATGEKGIGWPINTACP